MFVYPKIDPVALHIGPIKIYWYGIMYVVGFISAWLLALYRGRKQPDVWNSEQIGDLLFYCAFHEL